MNYKDISNAKKPSKKQMITSIILFIIGESLIVLFLITTILNAINPIKKSNYIYAYGYGLYYRDFAVFIGICFLISVVIYFLIYKRKIVNIVVPIYIILFSLIILPIVALVINIKEIRSLASYTQDFNNYGVYDEQVEDIVFSFSDCLPENISDNKLRYEYFFYNLRSIYGIQQFFSMNLMISYDDEEFINEYNRLVNLDLIYESDTTLQDYISYLNYNDKGNCFMLLINKETKTIVYSVQAKFYPKIEPFLENTRMSPYNN